MEIDTNKTEREIEIKKFIEDLKTKQISFENYKTYYNKVKDIDVGINFNIDSNIKKWQFLEGEFLDIKSHEKFKEDKRNKFVKLEAFDMVNEMHDVLKEILTQNIIQHEMYYLAFQKMFETLDDVKALDIKRESLKEMREMDTARNEMMKELIGQNTKLYLETTTAKFNQYDEKINNVLTMIIEQQRQDRIKMIEEFRLISQSLNPNIKRVSQHTFDKRPNEPESNESEQFNKSEQNKQFKNVFDRHEENLNKKEALDKEDNKDNKPAKKTKIQQIEEKFSNQNLPKDNDYKE